uniref:Uncharacterized protein n=1 Tax=Lepeophtheirus salmonis TaxID=72036 RepID=A0A0K2TX33_LEPSM
MAYKQDSSYLIRRVHSAPSSSRALKTKVS